MVGMVKILVTFGGGGEGSDWRGAKGPRGSWGLGMFCFLIWGSAFRDALTEWKFIKLFIYYSYVCYTSVKTLLQKGKNFPIRWCQIWAGQEGDAAASEQSPRPLVRLGAPGAHGRALWPPQPLPLCFCPLGGSSFLFFFFFFQMEVIVPTPFPRNTQYKRD